MIGQQFTITKKSNPTKFIKFNDHSSSNLIALQAYPTFDLEIRNDEIDKEGQHGSWDFFSFYGKRLIVFEGVIIGINEGEVHRLRDKMLEVTSLPAQPTTSDDGTVLIEWTDPLGRELQIEAKISTSIRFSRNLKQKNRLDFILIMKAPNPQIESQELIEDAGLRGYNIGGVFLTMKFPFTLDSNFINVITVQNDGNTEANTVFRLYGSPNRTITNPRITNLTTGDYIQVNITLVSEAEYVVINSKTGTVFDYLGADKSSDIEGGSSFILLDIGANDLLYTSSESDGASSPMALRYDPDEIAQVDHRDTII